MHFYRPVCNLISHEWLIFIGKYIFQAVSNLYTGFSCNIFKLFLTWWCRYTTKSLLIKINISWFYILCSYISAFKAEVSFKEIIVDDPLEKKNYAICIESQERDNLHVHSFLWVFNALNIENEAVYIEFF